MGRTVVDWSGRGGHPANVRVVHKVDAEGFFALLTERLGRL
jgi:purine nucleosidase